MIRRRLRLAFVLVVAGCSQPAWLAPAPPTVDRPIADRMRQVWQRAALERELEFAEALRPGGRAEARRRRLARGDLATFAEEGERLFALDAPWHGEAAGTTLPTHARSGPATADATRCRACHHVGGAGGSGRFADLALFDSDGDDVLSARRRLPRMLAGAALLERAAEGHPERQPFGWSAGRARRLRDFVAWSVTTHLAATVSDDEVDALTTFIALLPPPRAPPPPRDSLILRAQHGAELFRAVGCAVCHVASLTVEDPRLELSRGRRIDLRYLLAVDGQPPYEVAALSDLRLHAMGPELAEGEPDRNDRFVTTPLWGVASRGPFLHDGRAATIEEAILAHGGEGSAARDRFVALQGEQTDLLLYLATLGRPPAMVWLR